MPARKWERSGVVDGAGGSIEVLDALPQQGFTCWRRNGERQHLHLPHPSASRQAVFDLSHAQASAQDTMKIPNVRVQDERWPMEVPSGLPHCRAQPSLSHLGYCLLCCGSKRASPWACSGLAQHPSNSLCFPPSHHDAPVSEQGWPDAVQQQGVQEPLWPCGPPPAPE